MKVIKHGNTYKEIECEECGALLSYCQADIKRQNGCYCYLEEIYQEYSKSIICPECGNKIKLK